MSDKMGSAAAYKIYSSAINKSSRSSVRRFFGSKNDFTYFTGCKSLSTSTRLLEKSNYSTRFYFNMDPTHKATGAPCPPMQAGKIRIYSMRLCPFAQRAELVLLTKGIPHDVVNCHLKEKPEFLLAKNPAGKVPVIELSDGKILYESLIVCEFLDEYENGRKLHSENPFQKALDRLWMEKFGKTISAFYKILFSINKSEELEKVFEKYFPYFSSGLLDIDKELLRRQSKFYSGRNLPGMLDYCIWPWMERLPILPELVPAKYGNNVRNLINTTPTLKKWEEEMNQDYAVKEFILSKEVHKEFIQGLLKGSPNYDILNA